MQRDWIASGGGGIFRFMLFRILIALLLTVGIVAGNVSAHRISLASAAASSGQKSIPMIDDAGAAHIADALPPVVHTLKPAPVVVLSLWLFAVVAVLFGRPGSGLPAPPRRSSFCSRRIYLRNSVLLI
jgi:hypothetical protein